MVGEGAAPALGIDIEAGAGTFQQVFWFATCAMTAGQKIYVDHLANLAALRISICLEIIILGSLVVSALSSI